MKTAVSRMMIFLIPVLTAVCLFADRGEQKNSREDKDMIRIIISAGGETFPARFQDNPAARDLIAMMPLTITMQDLNRNEKYFRLESPLPAPSTERPGVINAGEIMLWSGNTLVLFYKTFSNSYGGYVRLGYIENPGRLAAVIGPGNVEITFSVPDTWD